MPQISIIADTANRPIDDFGLPGPVPGELSSPPFPGPGSGADALISWGAAAASFAKRASLASGGPIRIDFSRIELAACALRPLLAGLLRGSCGSFGKHVELSFGEAVTAVALASALEAELAIWRATELAIELVNARGNQLTPAIFVERAREVATAAGLGFRVTTAPELKSGGFGGITAIGGGAANPPALLELWYSGPTGCTPEPPKNAIALAGKGVTFDTGGLSIKPAAAMYSMHTDCAGAAVALGAMQALAEAGATTPVYAALPLVENTPGPDAVRPGDVVTTRAGIGLEIVDTDFEGRVILADAITTLAAASPRAIISLATLTYQISVALGPEIAGLFARDRSLGERVAAAADCAGEPLWPMPWAVRYARQLRSNAPGATLRNHPLADTGRAITAALFLGEFAPAEIPFAHIDFAGPAVVDTADGPSATGYGVRTLVELITGWGE